MISTLSTGAQSIPEQHSIGYQSCAVAAVAAATNAPANIHALAIICLAAPSPFASSRSSCPSGADAPFSSLRPLAPCHVWSSGGADWAWQYPPWPCWRTAALPSPTRHKPCPASGFKNCLSNLYAVARHARAGGDQWAYSQSHRKAPVSARSPTRVQVLLTAACNLGGNAIPTAGTSNQFASSKLRSRRRNPQKPPTTMAANVRKEPTAKVDTPLMA